jgi:hypothetical protein
LWLGLKPGNVVCAFWFLFRAAASSSGIRSAFGAEHRRAGAMISSFAMPLIGAEAVAASALALLSTAITSAYLADWLGLAIRPLPILMLSVGAAAAMAVWLRRHAVRDSPSLAAFGGCVGAIFTWLLWRARPDFLPTGSGPDLAHHLSLLEYIQRHWRLPHDVALYEYLGEMVDYTPGSHLLAVLAGAWFRSDALHAVFPAVAATVALKAGLVFLITRRLLPDQVPRVPFALIAVVLLFLAPVHFIGSFTDQSYLAQVVSELFAVAMWWALVVWDERPSTIPAAVFAIAGVATFLSWPVWVGPVMVLLAVLALLHREIPLLTRLQHLVIAAVPIGCVAAIHGSRHTGGFRMAGTGGFAIWPTPALLGWWFIALAAAGFVFCLANRRARAVPLLAAAIALQAAALYTTAQSSGAAAPYLALKMFYIAVYPLTIGAAVMVAGVWRLVAHLIRLPNARAARLAWVVAAIVAIAAARPLAAAPRPRPVVTQATLEAATWARSKMPPECIDYLTVDLYTAYWLHLAVFNQPRATGRALNDDTFDTRKSLERWILSSGLPLGVTDDFNALPRDIRTNVDVLQRFGPAAVVKRRGPSACGAVR